MSRPPFDPVAPALAPLELAQRKPVPSPCIGVCRIEQGLCAGCQRTLDEIAAWGSASDELRQAIWQRIAQRRAAKR